MHLLAALVALVEGDFAAAGREASASEAISAALGDAGARWRLGVHRAMAAWTQTAPVDRERAAGLRLTVGRAALTAWVGVQAGDRDTVRSALAELGPNVSNDADFALMQGVAVAFMGDVGEAERVYAILAAREGRRVLASMVGSAILDFRERVLLVLATAARRFDAIEAHAEAALTQARRLGSPVWAARIEADLADALEARAGPNDRARARECRERTLESARRFDMPGLGERCAAALARDVGHTRAAARSVALTDSVTSNIDIAPATSAATGGASRQLASGATVDTPPGAADARDRSQASATAHDTTNPRAPLTLTRHGALLWHLVGFGEALFLKDSRGLQMLARLLLEPDRPLHVLELSGAFDAETPRLDGGDAGPLLDATARTRYRERLADLARERAEAEAHADPGRLERANAEIDALGAELERAFGLGGRERKAGAASERARSNVQRRISHALEQIRAASPRLGEHLSASIRTGTHCWYQPCPR